MGTKQLKFIHESKITEMFFHEGMNVYEINRKLNKVFGAPQIAKFLVGSNARIENGYIIVQSQINLL